MKEFFDFPIPTASYGWNALFGMSEQVPVIFVLLAAFVFFFCFILFPLFFGLSFAERKLSADLQARVGPNRTPGYGVLQSLADLLKLGAKTENNPDATPKMRWFMAHGAALYMSFAFLPFGTALIFLDSEMGAFLPFLSIGLLFLISLFANEGARDLEDEILVHRQSFLWVSAWIPALIAVTVVVARTGSARWSTILASQSSGLFSWTFFSSPFGAISFFIFLFSGLIALQLPPFHTIDRGARHRSGVRFGMFEMNQFYATFAWCVLASSLFLGGNAAREISDTTFLIAAVELVFTLLKASVIFLTIRVVARALPQLRQDQMTEFCWRVLTPVAILCLVGELFWIRVLAGGLSG
ncbi:MAG: NADH-quinone oxidoreductase subunit H [Cryobacterium sp.]|nr:NADH-quinone oxidoreductase subunit H [Oligoflexia bacterium]